MNALEFFETWERLQDGVLDRAIEKVESAGPDDVRAAIASAPVSFDGFMALLSPAADAERDAVEKAARELTGQRFGRVVNLYIPLYLSNHCVNSCSYCGFSKNRGVPRKTLTMAEVEREAARLRAEGYRSVLLVAGEDGREVSVAFLGECVRLLKKMGFVFVGIEVQPLSEDEYRGLGAAGLDGVTIYQETYDRDVYERVHPAGPKRDFARRMETAGRAARAGIRSVGLGVLLGLSDFRREAILLAAHVRHIQKHYWQAAVSVSFPRLRVAPPGFRAQNPVSDDELFRMILAMRLANPDCALTLSTREAPAFRDRLFGAGITQVSAGSKTSPGGYAIAAEDSGSGEQFPVVDDRPPREVVEAIRGKGLEWVWKDWDVNLKPVS
ncbi:MAG: 2-iminoacetate synthase ThiH [Candidatus Nitrospinota bacterium M3_3B_026]